MGYPVAIVVYKRCFLLRLPFLSPYLIPPTDDREMTERRARVLLRDFFAQIFA